MAKKMPSYQLVLEHNAKIDPTTQHWYRIVDENYSKLMLHLFYRYVIVIVCVAETGPFRGLVLQFPGVSHPTWGEEWVRRKFHRPFALTVSIYKAIWVMTCIYNIFFDDKCVFLACTVNSFGSLLCFWIHLGAICEAPFDSRNLLGFWIFNWNKNNVFVDNVKLCVCVYQFNFACSVIWNVYFRTYWYYEIFL